MKYVYYGFGGFIGFVCGTLINLIFYWVEQSGTATLVARSALPPKADILKVAAKRLLLTQSGHTYR